jgi:small subunit ribosomal protein S15
VRRARRKTSQAEVLGKGIAFGRVVAYAEFLKVQEDLSETALRRPVVLGREMAITKEKKQEIIGNFGRGEVDTGSPEVQVALLTARIIDLTDHFKTHAKDHASRRGLLMMVSKRSSLLKYLRLHNRKKYLEVINRLGIRK